MKKNKATAITFIIIASFGIAYFIVLPFLNWFFGYHGYEKEKYRRNSSGDIKESKFRGAFQKKLNYTSYIDIDSIHSDSLNIFIERGYKYGYFSYDKTNFDLGKTKYPFQISQTERTNHNLVVYNFSNLEKLDSVGDYIYLKQPKLKDTLYMTVESFRLMNNKAIWDSIGYIKVFE